MSNSNRLHLWGVLKVDALFGVLRPDLCGEIVLWGTFFGVFWHEVSRAAHIKHSHNTVTNLLNVS